MNERPLDQVLDQPTTVETIATTIMQWAGIDKSDSFAQIVESGTPLRIQPLIEQMQPGDELWTCRSRVIAPLFGNRGVALVRGSQIIDHVTIMKY